MDRSAPYQLSDLAKRRGDALAIGRAAVAAVAPAVVLPQALAALDSAPLGRGVHLISVGKASAGMYAACMEVVGQRLRSSLVIGPGARPADVPAAAWVTAGHPLPTAGSVEAGRRALRAARDVRKDACLLLLVSGGASALMAAPIEGLSLDDKQHAARTVMAAGGDITALNALRKHLSAVKGGRLAAACAGQTVTLGLSDVVGDDLSVIGSGPGMSDASTWHDARVALEMFGGDTHRPSVVSLVQAGCRGALAETPKAADVAMQRASGRVIGGRSHAMEGARAAAIACGYRPVVLAAPVVGEARVAAAAWWTDVRRMASSGPTAVITSGETTVKVAGPGRGGRNQEFALTLVDALEDEPGAVVLSLGTDGIDGPTDAAGALVDSTTGARARAAGLAPPGAWLALNDSYAYLGAVGDLLTPGPSGTNVGDIQVLLLGTA